jgi:uncharacterized protein with ParB-like and HNH nuclease domain
MIKSANQYPISDIFSIETKVQYVVPRFQREYTWGKREWEDLYNDLLENDIGYFLGSIICVNQVKDALDVTPLEIIDGQQRLATISLFHSAIYERMLRENKSDEDFITEKLTLKYRLIQKGTKNGLKLQLSYQNGNFEDYKAILSEV